MGTKDFSNPSPILLDSVDREGGLSPFGRFSYHSLLLKLATNRLQLEDLLRRHPEILEVEIRAPIVIAGLQRTGTTHLHNLLSADPQLRFLPYWEAVQPVLASKDKPADGEADPRRASIEVALSFQDQAMPHFKRMHEMTAEHAHEEIHLLALDFSSMFFESVLPLPTFRDFYVTRDQTSAYRYLKKCLQV